MTQEIIRDNDNQTTVTAPQLASILEALQQHARTCETAAQDSTREARTGESGDKEKNTESAKVWLIKSQVWLEAEAVVRGITLALPPPVSGN